MMLCMTSSVMYMTYLTSSRKYDGQTDISVLYIYIDIVSLHVYQPLKMITFGFPVSLHIMHAMLTLKVLDF